MTATALAATDCRFAEQNYRLRNVVPADGDNVLGLFQSVFGQAQTKAWLDWKYAVGMGEAVGIWDEDGRLVTHYAGFPRLLEWQGQTVRGLQIGDVMVTPRMRGLLTRKGPLQQVCSRFFADRVGPRHPFRIAFGFPNLRHFKLGIMLGLYRDAGMILQLRWPAGGARLAPWWSWSEFDPAAANAGERMDSLWRAMREDLNEFVLGQRDANYVLWRFVARPDRRYRLFVLRRRWLPNPVALVVMRVDGDHAELLDVVAPRANFAAALAAARAEAARGGARTLGAWASPAVAEVLRGGAELEEGPSGAYLAVAQGSDFSAGEIAAARWWWMGGDTDFL